MVTTGAGPHAMLIEISKPLLISIWIENTKHFSKKRNCLECKIIRNLDIIHLIQGRIIFEEISFECTVAIHISIHFQNVFIIALLQCKNNYIFVIRTKL